MANCSCPCSCRSQVLSLCGIKKNDIDAFPDIMKTYESALTMFEALRVREGFPNKFNFLTKMKVTSPSQMRHLFNKCFVDGIEVRKVTPHNLESVYD